jgi:hypothetical protein
VVWWSLVWVLGCITRLPSSVIFLPLSHFCVLPLSLSLSLASCSLAHRGFNLLLSCHPHSPLSPSSYPSHPDPGYPTENHKCQRPPLLQLYLISPSCSLSLSPNQPLSCSIRPKPFKYRRLPLLNLLLPSCYLLLHNFTLPCSTRLCCAQALCL